MGALENMWKHKKIDHKLKQRFASEVFWHFVGFNNKPPSECFNILLCILKDGLKVGKRTEFRYVESFSADAEKKPVWKTLYGYKVSCLADIPLKDLHIHADRYGKYAIGFHKRSAVEFGFMPTMYTNMFSYDFHQFMMYRNEIESFLRRTDSKIAQQFENMLHYLGSVVKGGFLSGDVYNDSDLDEKQLNVFYYEREWRSIRDWAFSSSDVAAIILPGENISTLKKNIEKSQLKVNVDTIIVPFEMITCL